jgi:hypothetical protein
MQSKATTVAQYLAELPPDRREAINAVRKAILENLNDGFEEGMSYGMIGYYVPHRLYPAGYHCDPKQPLPFACLASQKNHMSVYLCTVYFEGEKWFREQWAKTGKKLDMGKSCVRFKKLDDLALNVVGAAIAKFSVARYIELYEGVLKASSSAKQSRAAASAKSKRARPPARKAKARSSRAGKRARAG